MLLGRCIFAGLVGDSSQVIPGSRELGSQIQSVVETFDRAGHVMLTQALLSLFILSPCPVRNRQLRGGDTARLFRWKFAVEVNGDVDSSFRVGEARTDLDCLLHLPLTGHCDDE